MTTKDVLIFKVETDGPVRSHEWERDCESFPALTRIGFIQDGVVEEYDLRETPLGALSVALDQFVARCHAAAMICGYNVHAETAAVKAALIREFGRCYYDAMDVEGALWKGKRIDLMRSGAKFADARDQFGNPKMPSLRELYFRVFTGSSWDGSGMRFELERMAELLPAMVQLHLVELKVREYDAKGRPKPRPAEVVPEDWAVKATETGAKPKAGKSPAAGVRAENTAVSDKLTDTVVERLLEYHARRVDEADAFGFKDAYQMHLSFIDWINNHR